MTTDPARKNLKAPEVDASELIFDTANTCAIKYAVNVHWTSWHTWDHITRAYPNVDEGIWQAMLPFASCLSASVLIRNELRTTFSTTPGLEKYVENIQLMTNQYTWPAKADTQYHAVVMVIFDAYCIVIDHALHPTAFRVPLEESFNTELVNHYNGDQSSSCYIYFMAITGNRMLIRQPYYLFDEVEPSVALRQLAIPGALAWKGSQVPPVVPRKHVTFRSLLNEQPVHVPSTPVDDRYLATTCQISVDFSKRTILMMILNEDWLLKPENGQLLKLLQTRDLYKRINDSVCHIIVSIQWIRDPPVEEMNDIVAQTVKDFEAMNSIAESLGFFKDELFRIATSVHRDTTTLPSQADYLAAISEK